MKQRKALARPERDHNRKTQQYCFIKFDSHTAPGLFGWPSQGGSQPDDRDFVFEDPFVWWDGSKMRWNLLCHQYNMTDAAHQYLDGGFAV
eukprot:COSAG06_NODE_18913_length_862_cov_1.283093_2_plen_89_part_01